MGKITISKTKRILVMVTAIALLAVFTFAAVSCNANENGNDDDGGVAATTQDAAQNEAQEATDPRNISDDLPDKDLGGREFNILCHEMLTTEFVAESEIGEVVNDAIYKRNINVADRFNINLNMVNIPGTWNDRITFMNTLKNSVLAGESKYDIVAGVTSYIPNLVPEGIFLNIKDMNYLNFSKPWWGEDLIKELSIGDKLYLVTGDIALSMWDCIFVFFFNKQIVQDNSIPNLYEIVKNKEWTYDKFVELSKLVSKDVNGDSVYDKNDMFGFVTTTGTVANAFSAAFDLKITNKNEDNIPYLNLDTSKWAEAITKLVELHYDLPSTLTLADGSDLDVVVPMFQENKILFYPQTLSFSRDFRAMETDFGILPFPLYDENQANYYSAVRNAMSLVGVPITASNPDDSGLIMEALAAESYKLVVPAYYDVSLKVKNTRDEESGEMLDIIRDNLWMNFGYSYSLSTGSVGNYIREMIEKKNANFMSTYESTFKSRSETFEKFIGDVLNLE